MLANKGGCPVWNFLTIYSYEGEVKRSGIRGEKKADIR